MTTSATPRPGLPGRGLKSASELAANRPHGDRLRYLGGCRCKDCRRANSAYEAARQKARKEGDWNGTVSAERARLHMQKLSACGVGRKSVAAASDVADSILWKIITGDRTHILARTERRILGVTAAAAADHALIDGAPTWKLIDELLAAGFSKARIAKELGRKSPALQISRDLVTVRNAYDVRQLHARLIASDEVLVDSRASARLIGQLRDELFPAKQLAGELGLQLGAKGEPLLSKRIRRRLELEILELHRRLIA